MKPLLKVEGLCKNFGGVRALDDVSFSANPGQITAVIGPNGAGKTTAINCISGIYKPDSGVVTFEDEVINKAPTHKLAQNGLTRTFQNLQVFTSLSVLENIMVGMHAKPGREFVACMMRAGFAVREERIIKEKSMEVLEFLGMADLARMPAGQLSYGDRKRVEMARALVSKPKMVLLDEPVAGLNIVETEKVGDTLENLKKQGIALVLVEHDMELVMRVSDTVVVLHFGRKIAEGTGHEIQNHPEVIHVYLGGGGKELGPIA